MITINGISVVGVPCGTRCSNMWLVFLINPNNINLIHKGRCNVSVRCLLHVNFLLNVMKKVIKLIISLSFN
jgi:hypothetical protein